MFCYRRDPDALLGAGVAFTSAGLDLSDGQDPDARAGAFARLAAEVGAPVAVVRQVHGATVVRVGGPVPGERIGLIDLTATDADALVTASPGVAVAVRVADCVPICLVAGDGLAVGAIHAGRAGLLARVIGAAVADLRALAGRSASPARDGGPPSPACDGGSRPPVRAWIGPHICAACYEVPEAMAADAGARLGIPRTVTSWGTPSLDLGAAALAQLEASGVAVERVGGCTLHDSGLHSHRGGSAGRLAGVAWLPGR